MTIEAYAIFVGVAAQMVVMSLLLPGWVAQNFRTRLERHYADERYARYYPDWDRARIERLLTGYRAVSGAIGLLGLGAMAWLYSLLQNPGWDIWEVRRVVGLYGMAQALPLILLGLHRGWVASQALKRAPPEPKRTATLQRRGLLDFVSPLAVLLAVLAYLLAVALSLYFLQNPVPEITYPLRPLGRITFNYALCAFCAYWLLYGKKASPLETRAERLHEAGYGVKLLVYAPIAVVVYVWLSLGLEVLHLDRWIPFSASAFLVILFFLMSHCLTAPPYRRKTAGLDPSPT